jgi:Alginate lyase
MLNEYNSMIKIKWLLIGLLVLVVNNASAQVKLSTDYLIKTDMAVLEKNKKAIDAKDASLLPAYNQLLKAADKLLKFTPVSVMDKTEIPPSGNKHDYVSLAPYWWPDSSKVDGLPYIRKDGKTNPEVKNYPDKTNMPQLCENVYFLGLAYYYSGNEKYAKHASKLLQVWFLDTATKMNPNLNFGQFVKGRNDGRGAGIVDTRQFIFAIDGVELIKKSKSWTKANNINLQKWFTEYLNWLTISKNGKDELDADNNHGVWYDAQTLAMAVFIENKVKAKEIVNRAINRLDLQMDKDGFFPLEMARTTSMGYSTFILNAFNIIAQLSEKTDIDFWNTQTKSGKSLNKGLQALLPYISKEKPWFGQQIKDFKYAESYPLFIKGAAKLKCTTCNDSLKKIAGEQNIIYKLL